MLSIEGFNIANLPFEGLRMLQEIEVFDDIPILVHYVDNRNHDIISYLVDFDNTGQRYLFAKIKRQELFDYLVGIKSLKKLFSEISSDFIFFVDLDNDHVVKSATIISKFLIPTKYFPVEDSFHDEEINNFYLDYLRESYYEYRLKQNAFIVKVESANEVHGKTVSAKDAAFVLVNATNSIEGYISVKSFNTLKSDFGNVNKIKRRVNTTKNFLSPRIAEVAFGSFEVWLAIDTLIFHGNDKYDTQIRDGLIEGYKQDVLDVDYTSEEDAKIIAKKYTEDERKMIFEPIFKIIENDDFIISIKDTKNTIKRNNKGLKSSKNFWETLLPPPTIQDLQKELERKNKIVTLVLNLREGENINKLTKKTLQDHLLFTKDNAETIYDILSPIRVKDKEIILSKPIPFILTIDENNHFQLFNEALQLYAEGNDFNSLVENIKTQFLNLVQDLKHIEEIDFPKATLIKGYLK